MRSSPFIPDRNTRCGTSSCPGLVSSSWTTCTRTLGVKRREEREGGKREERENREEGGGKQERGLERGREEGGEGEQGGRGGIFISIDEEAKSLDTTSSRKERQSRRKRFHDFFVPRATVYSFC